VHANANHPSPVASSKIHGWQYFAIAADSSPEEEKYTLSLNIVYFAKGLKDNKIFVCSTLPERACLLRQTCFRGLYRQQIYALVFLPGTSEAPKNWNL